MIALPDRWTPRSANLATGVAALGAGLAAVAAPAEPTTSGPANLILRVALCVVVTVAASRARTWTVVLLGGLAAASATGPAVIGGWVALVLAIAAGLTPTEAAATRRPMQALAGAIAVLCLFEQGQHGFLGGSALIGAAATLPVLVSALHATSSRTGRALRIAAWSGVGLVVVALGAFVAATIAAAPHLQRGADQAETAIDAARQADDLGARTHLRAAAVEFGDAQAALDAWWVRPVVAVPGLSQHLAAIRAVADEGHAIASSTEIIQPVSEYRGLKYQDGRIDLDRVRDLDAPVAQAATLLGDSTDRLRAVDRTWLASPVTSRLDEFEEELGRAADDADTASEVLDLLPALLGGDGTRHYFVAFTTPAEARGLGGFLGSYGELEAADGKVRMTHSGSVSAIDATQDGQRTLTGPKEYLARYGRFDPADYLRDVTFSPHLPYVGNVIAQLYPQAGGAHVDGVIVMDPYAVATLLEFTGPITVPGYPTKLTAENLPEITLREQYLEFSDRNDARKDLLSDATRIAFDQLLEGDLPSPEKMIAALGPMVRERRLMLWFPDEREEHLAVRMGAEGRMPEAQGQDAFLLAHQNAGNSKIDAYLQRSVDYDATVDEATGRVEVTATVTLRNDAPATGLPDYVIGNSRGQPEGTNIMNLTAFSAFGLDRAELDGKEVKAGVGVEAGLNAYDVVIDVPPESTRTLVLHLSGGVHLGDEPYRLVLAPQGQANPDEVTVTVDGEPATRCGSETRTARRPWKLQETAEVGAPGCRRQGS